MVRIEWCFVFTFCLVQFARCDDRFAAETERLRNTPPELSSVGESSPSADGSQVQARFLPFSASFSLSAGGNNAQSFSIAGSPDGIGLSQSASHGDGLASNGNPGSFSASQSSSIAAGLNGISASDSSSFAANHPLYGQNSQATGNSFALGQAAASSHGDVVNGQAISSAQSSVGGTHSQASSGSQSLTQQPTWSNTQPNYASGNNGDYYYNSNRRPTLTISVSDDRSKFGKRPSNGWYEVPDRSSRDWKQPDFCKYYSGWYRDPRCQRPRVTITKPGYVPDGNQRPFFENTRDPRQQPGGLQISTVSAGSSSQSGPGGLAIGHSSSQASQGKPQPSLTINRVVASGNAQAHAQGASASIHSQNRPGNLQANLSSGSIIASSRPGGFAQGSSHSSSSGGSSISQVSGSSSGGGLTHGSASSGSIVTFPGPSSQQQIIPKEFIRSAKKSKDDDTLEQFVEDLADTVYDILDY